MSQEPEWDFTIEFEQADEALNEKALEQFNYYFNKLNKYTDLDEAQKDLNKLMNWYVKNKTKECNIEDGVEVGKQWEINIYRMLESLKLKIEELSKEQSAPRMVREDEVINYDSLMAPIKPCGITGGKRRRGTRKRRRRRKRKTRKRRRKKSRKKRKRRKRRTRK